MRSGERDKDPNEHGLGSFPVLFTAQLLWIIMWFSHSYSNVLQYMQTVVQVPNGGQPANEVQHHEEPPPH